MYYLYMPNGGSGIGVAISDDPGGPFVDALGSTLISGGTPGVSDVDWIFDPACFVDDDGQAWTAHARSGSPRPARRRARVSPKSSLEEP